MAADRSSSSRSCMCGSRPAGPWREAESPHTALRKQAAALIFSLRMILSEKSAASCWADLRIAVMSSTCRPARSPSQRLDRTWSMTDARHNVTILVPGRLHEHAASRIDTSFRVVRIGRADAALIDGEIAGTVRGIAAMTAIDAAFIDALPKLEIIANFGVGYDAVDAKHAGARGIMVTNTPDVLTEEVADTTLGLLINTVRELPRAEQ